MSDDWKADLAAALDGEDYQALSRAAVSRVGPVIRFLTGRLYSGDDREKWQAVAGLGFLLNVPGLVDSRRATRLLERFVWALNDESGAVPYGVPEAMGEVLARRPELQPAFLPILCSLLTEEEMSQTGRIEQGALWAVGRVGPAAAACSPEVVAAVRRVSVDHPDAETRRVAANSLKRIEAACSQGGPPRGH